MRRTLSFFIILLLSSTALLAHKGHSHQVLGTVKFLHNEHLIVATKDGKETELRVNKQTKFLKGTKSINRSEISCGARVSVTVGEDGKTATTVKVGTATTK